MNTDAFLLFLQELTMHMQGQKLLLFVDGLPAHRAQKVRNYLLTQKHWLRIERLPSYAPELNPIEYLWGAMKKKHLGNARTKGIGALAGMIRKVKRKMNNSELLNGFLRASELFD